MSLLKCKTLKTSFIYSLLSTAILAGNAHAAGFGIIEQSVTGLGTAFAGGSSSATDASTIYFNPAGMTRLSGPQANFGAHIIDPNAKFKDGGSKHFTGASLDANNENGGDAGPIALVPNFYYSRPINQQWTFGVGMNAPFGLTTDYDDGWVGRYHALTSAIKTININPSLAYKASDTLSLGAGISAQYIDAQLTNAVDFGGACNFPKINAVVTGMFGTTCGALGLAPQANDGEGDITGDDWGWGYNVGMMWQASPQTRIGAAYRSRIKFNVKGEADFDTPTNAALIAGILKLTDTDVKADIVLPDSLSVGFNHEVNSKWTVNGDFTWTNWSVLDELRIKFDSGAADSVITTNWEDSNRYSLGLTYVQNKQWTWRGGIAFDESTTSSTAYVTPRVPDADRTWLTFGTTYKPSNNMSLDFGYAHLFVKDAKINKAIDAENALRGALVGTYEIDVNIISAQARWTF